MLSFILFILVCGGLAAWDIHLVLNLVSEFNRENLITALLWILITVVIGIVFFFAGLARRAPERERIEREDREYCRSRGMPLD